MNLATEILGNAGRLLLEYNESTGEIHRTLEATSRALTAEKCDVVVSYGGVAVSLNVNGPLLMPVRELRYNAALQTRVHSILSRVCGGELEPSTALAQLKRVEADTPRHSRWLAVLLLGFAAAGLAGLLGADAGAVMMAGLSTGLGLFARQQLGIRHFNLFTLPLTAAFIGAALGGLAIRLGWTHTPGLVLIVPSLMLIPGPHFINGSLDLVDNFIPMGLARLGLATSILVASALGIVAGIELTLPAIPLAEQTVSTDHLNVFSDMILAGIVTIGFAVFYNTAWPQVGLATAGGMIGHGLRFLALEAGWRLEVATFVGGLAVGVVSALIARSYKLPIAVISFAGAVTMMPGIQIYRALAGSLQLIRLQDKIELPAIARTLGDALQACLVVAALALGLIIAARVVPMLAGPQGTPASKG
ncbi:MAG: threonine/serine exporter family protein [Pirellulales bacterium]